MSGTCRKKLLLNETHSSKKKQENTATDNSHSTHSCLTHMFGNNWYQMSLCFRSVWFLYLIWFDWIWCLFVMFFFSLLLSSMPHNSLVLFFSFTCFSGTGNLNEYISHYETLNYDHHQIHASHSRAKRSVTKDPYVNLKFRAHNRPFHIRLKRDVDTFSDKLVVSCPMSILFSFLLLLMLAIGIASIAIRHPTPNCIQHQVIFVHFGNSCVRSFFANRFFVLCICMTLLGGNTKWRAAVRRYIAYLSRSSVGWTK